MKNISLLIVIVLFSSCASIKNSTILIKLDQNNCNQENSYSYSKYDIPKPIYELQIDTALISQFNLKDLDIANAIGILDLLSRYTNTAKEVKLSNTMQSQIDLLAIRLEINNRIDLTSLEISSVSAELDCEEERINQIASYLKEREIKRESKLTVGSIILGSLTAIVTGILLSTNDGSNTSDFISVGVGVADAVFGVLILTNNRTIEFNHPRNVLKEIWLATETSSVYPPSIWYYLNYRSPENQSGVSIREQLIENWKTFGQVNSTKGKSENTTDIYFSDGGTYSTDQLENRAKMYDQIESTIKLMKQDLRNLTLSIEKLKYQSRDEIKQDNNQLTE